jgi:DNA-binding NtrC family response regulator
MFRINNFTIKLPPLRERPEDIPSIAEHFLARVSGGNRFTISEDAMRVMTNYSWPGNVRELRNVIERAVILASDEVIRPDDLPIELRTHVPRSFAVASEEEDSFVNLDEMKKRQILTVLEQTGWHQGKASELLGISPSTLYRQLKSYGLTRTRRLGDEPF